MIVKPLGSEVAVSTTPSTISDALLVRIYAASASVITIKNASAETVGTFTVGSNSVEHVEKAKTDTVEASVEVKCSPVAYKS